MNFFSNPFILEDFGPDLPLSTPTAEKPDDELPQNAVSLIDLRIEINKMAERRP